MVETGWTRACSVYAAKASLNGDVAKNGNPTHKTQN